MIKGERIRLFVSGQPEIGKGVGDGSKGEVSVGEQEEWLKVVQLWEPGMSIESVKRRYAIFREV